jgi:hypothetical protein
VSKWKSAVSNPPPLNEQVWGYDPFYEDLHLAIWHGDRDDDGHPWLKSLEENGDDYCLALWQPCQQPKAPSRTEIEAAKDERN